MRTHLNASSFQLGVKTVHSTLQWRALNRQLQIAKTQREKFFVGQPRPRKRVTVLSGLSRAPGGGGAAAGGLCQRNFLDVLLERPGNYQSARALSAGNSFFGQWPHS